MIKLFPHALAMKLVLLVTLAGVSFPVTAGVADPMVTLTPTTINFGNQALGTSSVPRRIALMNIGTAELTITRITVTEVNSADFSQTHNCPVAPATLPAGASCSIDVIFKPSATGTETATLNVADNASGSPHSVELSGNGTPAAPGVHLAPVSLNFGNQPLESTSQAQTVILANTGSLTLSITGNIVITGENSGEFTLVTAKTTCPANAGQLPAGASCAITVSFAPTSAGAKTAQITVTDNAEGSPHVVPLSGTGTPK